VSSRRVLTSSMSGVWAGWAVPI